MEVTSMAQLMRQKNKMPGLNPGQS
jgi:hypothetical protein